MATTTSSRPSALTRLWAWLLPVQLIVIMGALGFIVGVTGTMSILLLRGNFNVPAGVVGPPQVDAPIHVSQVRPTQISPIFTSEVQHWGSQIVAWAQEYEIDPNMLATVIQIESCGDWQAGSTAGAQGLFQVMPFHFSDGEDMHDPDTNARAGIGYLKQSLEVAQGHFGLALAGYNGGASIINAGWARWADETRRYYLWGTEIYEDALQGKSTSAGLQDWLDAGGSILCNQAAVRQATTPTPAAFGALLR